MTSAEIIANNTYTDRDRFLSTDGGNTLLPLKCNMYSFIYDGGIGKTVLRLEVSDVAIDFAGLKTLLTNKTNIQEYGLSFSKANPNTSNPDKITTTLKLTGEYTNFTEAYKCNYDNGIYSVEITRKDATELLAEQNAANNVASMMAITDLYEASTPPTPPVVPVV